MARAGSCELAVVDLAEHEQPRLLLRRIGGQLGLLGVDVLEVAPALKANEQAFEILEHAAVGLVEGQGLPVGFDGLLGIVQNLFPDLGRAGSQLALFGHGIGHFGLLLQQKNEVGVVRQAGVDALKGIRGFHVPRRRGHGLLVGIGRDLGAAELVLGQGGDHVEDGVLGLVDLDGLHGRAVAGNQVVDATECLGQPLGARLRIVVQGILGQGLAHRLVGARRIVHAIFARRRDLVQELDLPPHIGGVARLDFEHAHEVGEVAAPAVHGIEQLGQGELVFGKSQQAFEGLRWFPGARARIRAAGGRFRWRSKRRQAALAQLTEPPQQCHLLLGLGGQIELALQIVGQIEGQALLHKQAVERAQRGQAARIVAQNFLPCRDGLVLIADGLFQDCGDADVDASRAPPSDWTSSAFFLRVSTRSGQRSVRV